MEKLVELRKEIDSLDNKLIEILDKRFLVVSQIVDFLPNLDLCKFPLSIKFFIHYSFNFFKARFLT
jgi:hypothetical protein